MAEWFMKIDGVIMPTPKECPITEFDLDRESSGRSESGIMNRDIIRTNVGSYDPEWEGLTVAEANLLRNAMMPASFTVDILFLGTTVRRVMSAGDRHWTQHFVNGRCHVDLTVQFTEV